MLNRKVLRTIYILKQIFVQTNIFLKDTGTLDYASLDRL